MHEFEQIIPAICVKKVVYSGDSLCFVEKGCELCLGKIWSMSPFIPVFNQLMVIRLSFKRVM